MHFPDFGPDDLLYDSQGEMVPRSLRPEPGSELDGEMVEFGALLRKQGLIGRIVELDGIGERFEVPSNTVGVAFVDAGELQVGTMYTNVHGLQVSLIPHTSYPGGRYVLNTNGPMALVMRPRGDDEFYSTVEGTELPFHDIGSEDIPPVHLVACQLYGVSSGPLRGGRGSRRLSVDQLMAVGGDEYSYRVVKVPYGQTFVTPLDVDYVGSPNNSDDLIVRAARPRMCFEGYSSSSMQGSIRESRRDGVNYSTHCVDPDDPIVLFTRDPSVPQVDRPLLMPQDFDISRVMIDLAECPFTDGSNGVYPLSNIVATGQTPLYQAYAFMVRDGQAAPVGATHALLPQEDGSAPWEFVEVGFGSHPDLFYPSRRRMTNTSFSGSERVLHAVPEDRPMVFFFPNEESP